VRSLALETMLRLHEGVKDTPYQDSLGHWTVGVGHLMSRPISQAAINQILADDIKEARSELDRVFPEAKTLNRVRQNVLIDMMFCLGANRFLKFKLMLAAIRAQDFDEAAKQMIMSKWAMQVKGRSTRLAFMMKEG